MKEYVEISTLLTDAQRTVGYKVEIPSGTRITTATENPEGSGANQYTLGFVYTTKKSTWLVPVTYATYTSRFGYRGYVTAGASTWHVGLDLAGENNGPILNKPIIAARDGTVSVAKYDSSAGYYVNIDHGDGWVTRYLHMTHYAVKTGDEVKAGQVIGYCGSTGSSTGPHLDYKVLYNGVNYNPGVFLGYYDPDTCEAVLV